MLEEFEITRRATNDAQKSLLQADWAKDPLTRAAWLLQFVPSAVITTVLIPVEFVISIPRMLFWIIPGVSLAFMAVNQAIYWIIYSPVLATSWLWREAPPPVGYLIRPLLIPIGVPLAMIGGIHCSLFLMGGPDEHGINKLYKLSLFQAWPMTVSMPEEVKRNVMHWESVRRGPANQPSRDPITSEAGESG